MIPQRLCSSTLGSSRSSLPRSFLAKSFQASSIFTLRSYIPQAQRCPSRSFGTSRPIRYDGVFSGLREMKHAKPWLRALAEREKAQSSLSAASTPSAEHTKPAELTPKRMSDSYHKIVLPLAQDEWLVDIYVNASGQLRLGSLFQDLDALAGVISYKHTGPHPTIVTAAVDRISIINPLSSFCDLELSGYVSYVGRSSMEISIEVRKLFPGDENNQILLTCAFTMVARDPVTKKATEINPLIVETEEEKRIFRRGEEYKKAKKALSKISLAKSTPNDEESDLIHALWLENLKYEDPQTGITKPLNITYMNTTRIQSTSIMQPQYRNRHSFMVFGGYLLKQTFELAFCCCSAFSHSRPTFISLDPSTFQAPVPVGSILYLKATVAYTEAMMDKEKEGGGKVLGSRVQVRVESRVRDVEHGRVDDTGVFNYTFWVEGKRVKVMPVTYSDFIDYIDARRRAQQQKLITGTDDGMKERVNE